MKLKVKSFYMLACVITCYYDRSYYKLIIYNKNNDNYFVLIINYELIFGTKQEEIIIRAWTSIC